VVAEPGDVDPGCVARLENAPPLRNLDGLIVYKNLREKGVAFEHLARPARRSVQQKCSERSSGRHARCDNPAAVQVRRAPVPATPSRNPYDAF
jgi:hypothetical protein